VWPAIDAVAQPESFHAILPCARPSPLHQPAASSTAVRTRRSAALHALPRDQVVAAATNPAAATTVLPVRVFR
jgi:hypothetical protein